MGIKRRFSKEFKLSVLKELETKRMAEGAVQKEF